VEQLKAGNINLKELLDQQLKITGPLEAKLESVRGEHEAMRATLETQLESHRAHIGQLKSSLSNSASAEKNKKLMQDNDKLSRELATAQALLETSRNAMAKLKSKHDLETSEITLTAASKKEFAALKTEHEACQAKIKKMKNVESDLEKRLSLAMKEITALNERLATKQHEGRHSPEHQKRVSSAEDDGRRSDLGVHSQTFETQLCPKEIPIVSFPPRLGDVNNTLSSLLASRLTRASSTSSTVNKALPSPSFSDEPVIESHWDHTDEDTQYHAHENPETSQSDPVIPSTSSFVAINSDAITRKGSTPSIHLENDEILSSSPVTGPVNDQLINSTTSDYSSIMDMSEGLTPPRGTEIDAVQDHVSGRLSDACSRDDDPVSSSSSVMADESHLLSTSRRVSNAHHLGCKADRRIEGTSSDVVSPPKRARVISVDL
jgi:hypothetical protein